MPLFRICSIRFSDSHPGVRIFIAHCVEVYPIAKPKEPVPVHYVVIIEILIKFLADHKFKNMKRLCLLGRHNLFEVIALLLFFMGGQFFDTHIIVYDIQE